MSATRVAPVPVLFHTSSPLVPSLAWKKSVPLTLVRYREAELPAPGLMSAARETVVPSLFHNSAPLVPPLLAAKNSVPPTLVKPEGKEPLLPGQRSATRT